MTRLFVCLLLGLSLSTGAWAQDLKVLVLHSYHQDYPWTRNQHRGFVTELSRMAAGTTPQVFTEYLDTKRRPANSAYFAFFADYLQTKYSGFLPDLLYCTDDNALRFAIAYRDALFPGVPLVFSGVNNDDLWRQAREGHQTAGVFERAAVEQTIDLALRLRPGMTRLLMVGDGSLTDSGIQREIQQQLQRHHALRGESVSDTSLEEVYRQLQLQGEGVVVLTTIGGFLDEKGEVVPVPVAVQRLASAGRFLLLSLEDTFLVDGVLGGVVKSGEAQGAAAAVLVEDLVAGRPFRPGVTVTGERTFRAIFDDRLLRQFQLDARLLPPESTILHRPESFYARYRSLVWGVSAFFLLQSLFILWLIVEIRHRREAEAEARHSHRLFRDMIEYAPDAVLIFSEDGTLQDINQQACRLLGHDLTELQGHKIWELDPEDSADDFAERVKSLALADIRSREAGYRHRDGHVTPVDVRLSWLETGSHRRLMAMARDITERKRAERILKEKERRLNYLAHHDPLTDLPNRLLFYDRLQQAMALAQRSDTQVALLFLDLDRFKTINDTLGHDIGDRLLCRVADRLRELVRTSDTVARLGGDEFVLVLNEIHDPEQAAKVAQKMLEQLPQPIEIEEHELHVTVSVGISLFPEDGRDIEELMKSADIAMYLAKEQGRNTYRFFQPELGVRAGEMLVLENALRKGIDQRQFVLEYQPQYDIDSGAIIGLEALVRWRHPERGMVPPADFIPLAEETGLIVPLGNWVLQEACRQNRRWQQMGLSTVPVAVNLSPCQFRQPDLLERVRDTLEDTGLAPELLELEITEGTLMDNLTAASMVLQELHTLGVRVALDDFGTGYSSMVYLRHFPLTTLKIDKVFVDDLEHDSEAAAIVSTIIALGAGLGLKVLAEGIERPQQRELLRERGCHHGQGHLFSPPLSAERVAALLMGEVWRPHAAGHRATEQAKDSPG